MTRPATVITYVVLAVWAVTIIVDLALPKDSYEVPAVVHAALMAVIAAVLGKGALDNGNHRGK